MRNCPAFLPLLLACCCLSFKGDRYERVNMHVMGLIRNEGFNRSKVMETLFQMTDLNGPRLTGSTGMKNAEKWAKERLESFGLTAKIEPWGGFGKGWEINKSYLAMTAPYYQALIAVPRAWTPGTNGLVKTEAVLVRIEHERDFAKYAGKLRDKIVVLAPDKDENTPNFKADASRNTEEDLRKLAMDPHMDESATNLSQEPPKPAPAVRPQVKLRMPSTPFLLQKG